MDGALRPGQETCRDEDAERAVLASILLDNEVLDQVRSILQPEHFWSPHHATVYTAALTVNGRGQPVDVLTLATELRAMERLNTVGGPQFLGDLTDHVPSVAHVRQHAYLVRDAWRVREAQLVAFRLRGCRAASEIGPMAERLRELSEDARAESSVKTMEQVLDEYVDRAMAEWEETAFQLYWPFPTLRRMAKGPRGGQLITIAARPGKGKSVMGECLALEFAEQLRQSARGEVVLFFTLEMDHFEWAARAIAATARINHDFTSLIRVPGEQETHAMDKAIRGLRELPIVVDDLSRQTPASMRAVASRVKRERGLACIILDYLQLVNADTPTERRQLEIGMITKAAKQIAKDLDVPVIDLAQLNREAEKRSDGIPRLIDLREAGDIEQDSNAVLFIADGEKQEGIERESDVVDVRLVVAKYRGARTGTVDLVFRKDYQRFDEKIVESAYDGAIDGAAEDYGEGFDGQEPTEVTLGRPVPRGAYRGGGGHTADPEAGL